MFQSIKETLLFIGDFSQAAFWATNLCLRVLIGDLVLSQSLVKTSSGNFGQLPNLCLRVQQLGNFGQSLSTSSAVRTLSTSSAVRTLSTSSAVRTLSTNFGQLPNLCLRVQQLEPTKAQSSAVRQILELCLRVQQLDKFWATAQSLSTSSAVRTD